MQTQPDAHSSPRQRSRRQDSSGHCPTTGPHRHRAFRRAPRRRAVVDLGDTLFDRESSFDTTLNSGVLGGGSGRDCTTCQSRALGTTEANYLLDTNTVDPVFSGEFNDAESRSSREPFLDGLSGEDHINQLFGATATESQAAILEISPARGPADPRAADVTLAELTTAVDTSAYDTDLTAIANADFAQRAYRLAGLYAACSAGGRPRRRPRDGGGFLATILSDLSGPGRRPVTPETTESAGVGAPALSVICEPFSGRRELPQAGGQRHRYSRLDPSAVADVLGFLNPSVGVHARHQIAAVVRDHHVDRGVSGCGQLSHPPA